MERSASASKASNGSCNICHQRQAIYTCPGCAIRTCSLLCSKSHKSTQSCSGERDKTAYVPMNKYSWGTMANDYAYLEEVGRKAADWGLDIVKGALWTNAVYDRGGRGRGHGRGRGKESRSAPRGGAKGNRDLLRMHLDARDIDMEILPPGMQRRQINQSMWDARSKSPLMTVEFVFHRAKDPFAPSDSSEPPSFVLLTHRNNLDTNILDVIRRCFRNHDIPSWMESLISSPENEDTELIYLICQHSDTPFNPVAKAYHKLDPKQSLLKALRNRTFVEYPTIDIWGQGDFTGALIEADGTFVEGEEELRPVKRRRLDVVGGRKLIKSLLGGYTSNEEDEEEEVEEHDVLNLLGSYGTDEESMKSVNLEDDHDPEEEVDNVEEPTLALADILDSVGPFTDAQMQWKDDVKEGEVDWSDSTDNEAEPCSDRKGY